MISEKSKQTIETNVFGSIEDHSTAAGFFSSRKTDEPKFIKTKKKSEAVSKVRTTNEEQKLGGKEDMNEKNTETGVDQDYFSFIGVIDNSNFKIF